jgi:hypothetical protein
MILFPQVCVDVTVKLVFTKSMAGWGQQFKRNAQRIFSAGLRSVAIFSVITAAISLTANPAKSDSKAFVLQVPPALQQSGFLKHLLPRFSLKTGVRITVVTSDEAADLSMTETPQGPALFEGLQRVWYLSNTETAHPGVERFTTWLRSEVGLRTIVSFKVDGVSLFQVATPKDVVEQAASFGGDAIAGAQLSKQHCSRCHAVSEATRMTTIGSTPSFFILRSFSDWDGRFLSFYALNPHPAFTQVADVTEPFDPSRPSPIVPMELTLDDLEAIVAYVDGLPPADLGSDLVHQ